MARQRKPRVMIELPTPAPHHHAGECSCEWVRPYIRVSKVGNRKFLISPEIQMRAIEDWAVRNNKRLLPPYCDINKSGRSFRKRSVDKIIEEIKNGDYREVVLWKWSRWARNQAESAIYSKKVQDGGGVVSSATEDFDLSTAIGRLAHGLTGQIDQYQSELLSEGWRSVHAIRREDGLPHGGRERFGYDYGEVEVDGARTMRYEPNGEADDLKTAYTDWLNNASYEAIARNLNDAGWVTMLGGTWTPQGVARMMDTGFAAGLIRERSSEMTEKIEKGEASANSIASYDIWRVGAHQPIIDLEVWERYKAARIAKTGLPPRSKRPAHGLSALLYCTVCRRRLSTKYAGAGRTHQWYCTSARIFHKDIPVSVNNRLTLLAVREWIKEQVDDRISVNKYAHEARRIEAERKHNQADRQKRMRNDIKTKEAEVENLLKGVAIAGDSVAERYNRMIAALLTEIEELNAELRRSAPKARPAKDLDSLRQLDEVWDELPPPVLQEALSKIVSRIEVSPRSSSSTRTSAADRISPVGSWEDPDLDEWLSSRPA